MTVLQSWDLALFRAINDTHLAWLDTMMVGVSERWFWIPAYLLILYFIFKRTGWPQVLGVLLAIGLTILLADQLTSGLLKPWVARYRPCRPEAGLEGVQIVGGHCGGKYGFASSHAANFFGLASFLSLYFRKNLTTALFFSSAVLVAFSRVYLGVHYPGDVLVGALIGLCAGGLSFWLWNRFGASSSKKPPGEPN